MKGSRSRKDTHTHGCPSHALKLKGTWRDCCVCRNRCDEKAPSVTWTWWKAEGSESLRPGSEMSQRRALTTTRAGRTATTSAWNSPKSFNCHTSNLYKELFRLSTLAAHSKTINYSRLWLEYEGWVQNCLFGFHSSCSSEYLENSLLSLHWYTHFCSAHDFQSLEIRNRSLLSQKEHLSAPDENVWI